jgi:hypothetical protein
LTAGPRRLLSASDPSRDMSAAALCEVRFEIAPTEPKRSPDLEVGKPTGASQVVDRRHRQAQQVCDLLGGQELVVERDD